MTDTISLATNAPLTTLERTINNNDETQKPIKIGEHNDTAINRSHELLQTNESTSTTPHPLDMGNSNGIPFRPTRAAAFRQRSITFQVLPKKFPKNIDTLGLMRSPRMDDLKRKKIKSHS